MSLLLKLLRLGAITTSRGSLFQGFTTLKAKESLPSLLTYLFFDNFLGCPLVSALTERASSSLCNEKNTLASILSSGQVLDEVMDSKYLGVTISDNLDWSKHITTTTTKANARLSFIKRNLKDCPQKLKEIAYFSLVRSIVDYASAVWDPHQKFNQVKLEMVQRRAARFVKSRYKRTDSVTAMLDELGWPILSKRRKDARLILFYKIINNLAQVPHEHILTKAYEGTRKKNNHKFRHIA